MYLMEKGNIIKEFKISLGANPKGHKERFLTQNGA